MLIAINEENFQSEVLENQKLVLVDFYADWCGPCRMLMPILAEIAEENDHIDLFKLNVDENTEIANIYEVRNLPTLLIFKDGKVLARNVGSATKLEIENWIRSMESSN